MLPRNRFLHKVLIQILQNIQQRTIRYLLHTVQNLLIPLLRHNTLLRIAIAMPETKQLLENHLQFQLRTPAEVFGERQCHTVAVVDLRKHVAVRRIHHMPAQHAGERVARQHRAFARSAACHDIIRRTRFQKQRRQKPRLHIRQLAFVLRRVHAVVHHFVAHRFNHLAQHTFNHRVFGSLTVLVDQRNFHRFFSSISSADVFPF